MTNRADLYLNMFDLIKFFLLVYLDLSSKYPISFCCKILRCKDIFYKAYDVFSES